MSTRPATAYRLTPEAAQQINDSLSTPPSPLFPRDRDGRALRMGPEACNSKFDLVLRRPPSMLHLRQHMERVSRIQDERTKARLNLEFYGSPARRATSAEANDGQPETFGRCAPISVYQTWLGYCTVEVDRLVDAGINAVLVQAGDSCAIYARPIHAASLVIEEA